MENLIKKRDRNSQLCYLLPQENLFRMICSDLSENELLKNGKISAQCNGQPNGPKSEAQQCYNEELVKQSETKAKPVANENIYLEPVDGVKGEKIEHEYQYVSVSDIQGIIGVMKDQNVTWNIRTEGDEGVSFYPNQSKTQVLQEPIYQEVIDLCLGGIQKDTWEQDELRYKRLSQHFNKHIEARRARDTSPQCKSIKHSNDVNIDSDYRNSSAQCVINIYTKSSIARIKKINIRKRENENHLPRKRLSCLARREN